MSLLALLAFRKGKLIIPEIDPTGIPVDVALMLKALVWMTIGAFCLLFALLVTLPQIADENQRKEVKKLRDEVDRLNDLLGTSGSEPVGMRRRSE